MRIVGFGAHPDDVEIFFAGFLLSCQAHGHEIGWVIATDGRLGFEGDFKRLSQAQLAAARREEALAAGQRAGVQPVFMGLPDGSLKADAELAARLAGQVEALSPDIAVTHSPNDCHADHRALSMALSAATGTKVPILFADTMRGIGFEPMCCVDITSHFLQKQDAILCHASQLPERFVYVAKTMNAFRAMQCMLPPGSFAEGFRLGEGLAPSSFEALLPAGYVRRLAA